LIKKRFFQLIRKKEEGDNGFKGKEREMVALKPLKGKRGKWLL
jgi:hypothetical protein